MFVLLPRLPASGVMCMLVSNAVVHIAKEDPTPFLFKADFISLRYMICSCQKMGKSGKL